MNKTLKKGLFTAATTLAFAMASYLSPDNALAAKSKAQIDTPSESTIEYVQKNIKNPSDNIISPITEGNDGIIAWKTTAKNNYLGIDTDGDKKIDKRIKAKRIGNVSYINLIEAVGQDIAKTLDFDNSDGKVSKFYIQSTDKQSKASVSSEMKRVDYSKRFFDVNTGTLSSKPESANIVYVEKNNEQKNLEERLKNIEKNKLSKNQDLTKSTKEDFAKDYNFKKYMTGEVISFSMISNPNPQKPNANIVYKIPKTITNFEQKDKIKPLTLVGHKVADVVKYTVETGKKIPSLDSSTINSNNNNNIYDSPAKVKEEVKEKTQTPNDWSASVGVRMPFDKKIEVQPEINLGYAITPNIELKAYGFIGGLTNSSNSYTTRIHASPAPAPFQGLLTTDQTTTYNSGKLFDNFGISIGPLFNLSDEQSENKIKAGFELGFVKKTYNATTSNTETWKNNSGIILDTNTYRINQNTASSTGIILGGVLNYQLGKINDNLSVGVTLKSGIEYLVNPPKGMKNVVPYVGVNFLEVKF